MAPNYERNRMLREIIAENTRDKIMSFGAPSLPYTSEIHYTSEEINRIGPRFRFHKYICIECNTDVTVAYHHSYDESRVKISCSELCESCRLKEIQANNYKIVKFFIYITCLTFSLIVSFMLG